MNDQNDNKKRNKVHGIGKKFKTNLHMNKQLKM